MQAARSAALQQADSVPRRPRCNQISRMLAVNPLKRHPAAASDQTRLLCTQEHQTLPQQHAEASPAIRGAAPTSTHSMFNIRLRHSGPQPTVVVSVAQIFLHWQIMMSSSSCSLRSRCVYRLDVTSCHTGGRRCRRAAPPASAAATAAPLGAVPPASPPASPSALPCGARRARTSSLPAQRFISKQYTQSRCWGRRRHWQLVLVGGARAPPTFSACSRSISALLSSCGALQVLCFGSGLLEQYLKPGGKEQRVGVGWEWRWRRRHLWRRAQEPSGAHCCCLSASFLYSPGHFIGQAVGQFRRDFAPLGTLVTLDPRDRLQPRWCCRWRPSHFWACAQGLAKSMIVGGEWCLAGASRCSQTQCNRSLRE